MAAREIRPTRVMTSPDVAVNPKRASMTKVDLIFRRQDGWELGCGMAMVFWAHRTWAAEWESVFVKIRPGIWHKMDIAEWRESCFGPHVTIQLGG